MPATRVVKAVGVAPITQKMFSFSSVALRARRDLVVLFGVLVMAASGTGCAVHVTQVPEGQSNLVYTPKEVADGLSDPVVGEVDIQLAIPECGTEMLIPCPAKAYDPSDYLGMGGSHTVVVEVAAGDYTRRDIRGQLEANRHDTVKNLFVLARANVMVQGPKRLRDHVLALLRGMPAPTTRLGDVPVPTTEPTIHGPSQTAR